MASIDNCRGEIEKAIGRALTTREISGLGREASKLKTKIDAVGGDRARASQVMQNYLADREAIQSARKAMAASTAASLVKQDAKWNDMGEFSKQNPAAAAKSFFVSSEKNFKGTKDSLGINMDHASADTQANFVAQISKLGPGMIDWANDTANDKNIMLARAALGRGEDASKYGADAVKVAQVVKAFQDRQEAQFRGAGVPRGHIDDYMMARQHDPHKLAKAGDNNYGSNEARDQWVSDVSSRMDWGKSFGGELANAPAEQTSRLRSLYKQFIAGDHLVWHDASSPIKNREIEFNKPEDEHWYHQTYGNGDSYFSKVQSQLGRNSSHVAMANEWGPNAKSAITKWLDQKSKDILADHEGEESNKQFQDFKKAKDKITDQWLPYYTGELHAVNSGARRWTMEMEGLMNTARIGAALPKMFMDVALKANYMARFGGDASGGFWSGLRKGVLGQVDYMAKRGEDNKEAARQAAAHGGILLRGAGMPVSDSVRSLSGPGSLGKMNLLMMKLGPHNGWTDAMRINAAADEGFDHYTQRDKTFDQLPQGKQNLFQMFGMGSKEWDTIRKSNPVEMARSWDASAFEPGSLAKMDLQHFSDLAGPGASDNVLRSTRDELVRKYRNLIGEVADRTTVSPSSEMAAAMRMGINENTALGSLVRPFLALKGFMSNYFKNHVYGNVVGADKDPMNVGWGKAMAAMVKHPAQNASAWGSSARLIAVMWGMGYLATTLSDLASGKTTENPVGEHWGDAAVRAFGAGALGPMSDLMMTQNDSHGATHWQDYVGEYAGPSIETVGDLGTNFLDATKHAVKSATGYEDGQTAWKNISKDASYSVGDAYHSLPMSSLLWTKAATDYLVYDNLMDLMNPGYKDRMRAKMQKDRGQSLILDGGNGGN